MKSPEAKQALKDYLMRLPADKRQELTAVTPEGLGQPLLLHISYDNMLENFSPYVTKRTVEGEDRSIPRVCTAPTLMGCILAYQNDHQEFLERPTTTAPEDRKVAYNGGWIIYGLPFDYALRPSPALLPEADRTDEHWLITYDQYTSQYRPVRVGKMFYERVEYRGTNTVPDTHTSMIVEVSAEMSLKLDHRLTLTTGYWRVQMRNVHRSKDWRSVEFKRVQEIREAEYFTLKGAVANLLSMDNPIPPSLQWTAPAAS